MKNEKKLKSNLKVIKFYIGIENLTEKERDIIQTITNCEYLYTFYVITNSIIKKYK